MKSFTILSLALVLTSVCHAEPTPPEGYKLVWSDEFNVDGAPDPKSWVFEEGFKRNRELQWYQKDNAVCKDGVLVIEGTDALGTLRSTSLPDLLPDWIVYDRAIAPSRGQMTIEGRPLAAGMFTERGALAPGG